jgi:hypothetical protein
MKQLMRARMYWGKSLRSRSGKVAGSYYEFPAARASPSPSARLHFSSLGGRMLSSSAMSRSSSDNDTYFSCPT